MKMLLVLLNKQGQILLCRNPSGYSVPTNGAEVDESFGFGSPQEGNRWFWENCGLFVYRRYICFYKDYCAAVFELYGEDSVGKEFIWMDSGSINKFIVENSLTVLLKAVVKNYNCSKTVSWVNKDGFQPYLNWALKATGCDGQLTYGKIEQIKVPDTLCHGDLRPGNIRVVNGFCFLYDWGMGMYGHPFYDVVHFLHVTRRQLPREQQVKIKNTYLKQWETFGTGKDIRRLYETVEQLKDFFMVLADADWLIEMIEAVGGKVPEGSMGSWLLMRRVYYFRRVLGRFLAGDNN